MLHIAIANRQRRMRLNTGKLRRWSRAVLAGEGIDDADLSLAFVDNRTIHELNRRFLSHDEPTDVITFPLSSPGEVPLSGEIVISAETAAAVARARGHRAEAELALYLIHGLLHLCGYDDMTPRKRKAMRAREAHYLECLGVFVTRIT